ncbi:hypothetical protein S40285_10757, partial [Stachybotrys chlorohalonatus IBT 40285]
MANSTITCTCDSLEKRNVGIDSGVTATKVTIVWERKCAKHGSPNVTSAYPVESVLFEDPDNHIIIYHDGGLYKKIPDRKFMVRKLFKIMLMDGKRYPVQGGDQRNPPNLSLQ